MTDLLLKRSKFIFHAFGDAVSEKDYEASDFSVSYEDEIATFTLKLKKSLDYSFFETEKSLYDTFIFEGSFIKKKVVAFLTLNSTVKYFKFKIVSNDITEFKLTGIKVQSNAIVLLSF